AIACLLLLLCVEAFRLYQAWRRGEAGARIHLQIAGLFSVIAATPAILLAVAGSLTLERALNPAFIQDVRGFVEHTTEAATLFRDSQCRALLQETRLTASDLDRGKGLFDVDRALFHDFLSSRVRFLGFLTGALITRDGKLVDQVGNGVGSKIIAPDPSDFE